MPEEDKRPYTGRCHCRDLTFKCTSKPIAHIACHCQDCRQATGDDFSAIAFFKKADFTQKGKTITEEFTASSGNKTSRTLCPVCGTVMFDESSGFPDLIGVFSRRIFSPSTRNPKHHVWVSSKLSDIEIPKGVKSYKKGLTD